MDVMVLAGSTVSEDGLLVPHWKSPVTSIETSKVRSRRRSSFGTSTPMSKRPVSFTVCEASRESPSEIDSSPLREFGSGT